MDGLGIGVVSDHTIRRTQNARAPDRIRMSEYVGTRTDDSDGMVGPRLDAA
jgi:hypothetical protein